MKKLIITIFLSTFCYISQAQSVSVEHSINSIQTGFLGVWYNNETRLSNTIALRTEAGMNAGFQTGSEYQQDVIYMLPTFGLSPRWYYNIKKRAKKLKRVENNSASFIALEGNYSPDWFVISNVPGLRNISDVSMFLSWGIRRNLVKDFNYELGGGLGYIYTFYDSSISNANPIDFAFRVHLRIGYSF
ncbi:hypothetical protein [Flammeovirga sp. SubArs3]|uniref:hypothetical protein n=1 Tax=Flammeovirga sp. SubArs3 TaxID=2995316 RepID=UPI00248BD8B6|nr:hypothetical protein [Flammeovirga sp. SubArs3]